MAGAARTFRPVSESRVSLNPDEVILTRQLQEPVVDAGFQLERARTRLGAILVLDVGDGECHAGRNARVGADRGGAAPVRLEQVVNRALGAIAVVGVPGRVDPEQPSART